MSYTVNAHYFSAFEEQVTKLLSVHDLEVKKLKHEIEKLKDELNLAKTEISVLKENQQACCVLKHLTWRKYSK